MEYERNLLMLSLEFAAAKEPVAAVEAFGRYLQERFKPDSMENKELAMGEAGFPKKKLFMESGKKWRFLLPLQIAYGFTLEGCKAELPSAHELESIDRMTHYFNEKYREFMELKGLTYTDDLTGLYNQRYLELILDRELAMARRNNTPFSILFLDLDHFKNVNDTRGHLIGSRLLFEVGVEIKKTLRESDITFRYGGDEFVMMLANTGLDDAMMVAERIRQRIEKKRFLAREELDLRLTASIGVATFPEHAASKSEILQAADDALYGVKKEARNKVTAAKIKTGRDKS